MKITQFQISSSKGRGCAAALYWAQLYYKLKDAEKKEESASVPMLTKTVGSEEQFTLF